MGEILHVQLLRKVVKAKKPQVTKSQGFFNVAWLVGFEPTTLLSVKKVLYPLSYSQTRAEPKSVNKSDLGFLLLLWIKTIFGSQI